MVVIIPDCELVALLEDDTGMEVRKYKNLCFVNFTFKYDSFHENIIKSQLELNLLALKVSGYLAYLNTAHH